MLVSMYILCPEYSKVIRIGNHPDGQSPSLMDYALKNI